MGRLNLPNLLVLTLTPKLITKFTFKLSVTCMLSAPQGSTASEHGDEDVGATQALQCQV